MKYVSMLVVIALALGVGSAAKAQTYACPTSGSKITIENWSMSGNNKVYLGQSAIGGQWYVNAIVWDAANKRYTNRLVRNSEGGYLTGGKLAANSFLCLGAGDDYLEIVTVDTTLPGMSVLKPLNFNGFTLNVYGEDGASNMTGGPGAVLIYGSGSCDYISTDTGAYRPASTVLTGGSSADFLWGGNSASDRGYGQDGNDILFDRTGLNDWLYGGAGTDCLEDDDGHYNHLSCGTGTDYSLNASTDGTCEFPGTTCAASDDTDLICGDWLGTIFPGS